MAPPPILRPSPGVRGESGGVGSARRLAMPFWLRNAVPALAALCGLATVAGLYFTSTAPPGATFVNHLTAGESWRPIAALLGTIAAMWGISGLLGDAFKKRR